MKISEVEGLCLANMAVYWVLLFFAVLGDFLLGLLGFGYSPGWGVKQIVIGLFSIGMLVFNYYYWRYYSL
jgi:hypothetical protein